MCIKGFVYRLSHDCHFDIDRDISTAHRGSSSGDEDLQYAVQNVQNVARVIKLLKRAWIFTKRCSPWRHYCGSLKELSYYFLSI